MQIVALLNMAKTRVVLTRHTTSVSGAREAPHTSAIHSNVDAVLGPTSAIDFHMSTTSEASDEGSDAEAMDGSVSDQNDADQEDARDDGERQSFVDSATEAAVATDDGKQNKPAPRSREPTKEEYKLIQAFIANIGITSGVVNTTQTDRINHIAGLFLRYLDVMKPLPPVQGDLENLVSEMARDPIFARLAIDLYWRGQQSGQTLSVHAHVSAIHACLLRKRTTQATSILRHLFALYPKELSNRAILDQLLAATMSAESGSALPIIEEMHRRQLPIQHKRLRRVLKFMDTRVAHHTNIRRLCQVMREQSVQFDAGMATALFHAYSQVPKKYSRETLALWDQTMRTRNDKKPIEVEHQWVTQALRVRCVAVTAVEEVGFVCS